MQDSIAKNEAELQKERELFKNLNNHHVALRKQLEQLARERDDNDNLIRTLRERERGLNDKLKATTEELARSEGTQIKVELKNHVEARRKHLDEVRNLLDNLGQQLSRVNAEEEYKGHDTDYN